MFVRFSSVFVLQRRITDEVFTEKTLNCGLTQNEVNEIYLRTFRHFCFVPEAEM